MNLSNILSMGRGRDDGFSLSEMMLTCVILPVTLAASFLVFQTLSTNYDTIQTKADITGDTQQVLDTMVREIRQAQEIASGGGAFSVATPSTCTFYSDIDHDGVPERVSYYVNAGALYRVVGRAAISVFPYNYVDAVPARVLDLGGGPSGIFTYYDNGVPPGTVTSSALLNTIAVVGIDLRAAKASKSGAVSADMSTQVKVRSLFNSLK
jgi:hypothetical protein